MVKGLRKVKSKSVSIATSWLGDYLLFSDLLTSAHFWFSFDPVTSYWMKSWWNMMAWWNFSAIFMFVATLGLLWSTFIPEYSCLKPHCINCVYNNFIRSFKNVFSHSISKLQLMLLI